MYRVMELKITIWSRVEKLLCEMMLLMKQSLTLPFPALNQANIQQLNRYGDLLIED